MGSLQIIYRELRDELNVTGLEQEKQSCSIRSSLRKELIGAEINQKKGLSFTQQVVLHGLRAVHADGALLEDVLQELGPLRQTGDRERDIVRRHVLGRQVGAHQSGWR